MPAGHTVQAAHDEAPAAAQVLPAAHAVHTVSLVAVHAPDANLPAAHCVHGEQGRKPLAFHVLPGTQAEAFTQASAATPHTYDGALQAQLDWPVSVLFDE